ncbi:hypothetical protein SAMN03159343_1349 [Klenkia marina]|uniref:Uncharacterized protein n=1 Tax=Klenkia marina TaxID=1960309 RepID=A0A1G4XSC7_9ACTN|nr:hypothetical protein [Klenkia marina]SCX44067.1 hypothetical protein SAMN03159343_1349 [Klenkia marina]
MIPALVVGAEVAFWVVLVAGLLTRYALRRPRLGALLLLCVPLVDVVLLAVVALDLARGAAPDGTHTLAALYLGVTVAFGHPLVRWADARVAHRFGGAPPPTRPERGSRAYVRSLWVEWGRVVLAAVLAVAVLAGLGLVAGTGAFPSSTSDVPANPLWAPMGVLPVVVGIWFLAGPAFARVTVPASAQR